MLLATAYGVHRHRGFMSVAGDGRGIFFAKGATFAGILGTRDLALARAMAENQSIVPGGSKSFAVMTLMPGAVVSGGSMRMMVRAAPAE